MSQSKCEWIALGYSIPATPSRGRVYVWRQLQTLGAQLFRPGTAILLNSRENLARLETLAHKIKELGGEAHLLELNFLTPSDSADMHRRFDEATEREYRRTLDECAQLLEQLGGEEDDARRVALEKRLRKTVGRYRQSPLRSLGGQAAGELGAGAAELLGALRALPSELSALLRRDISPED